MPALSARSARALTTACQGRNSGPTMPERRKDGRYDSEGLRATRGRVAQRAPVELLRERQGSRVRGLACGSVQRRGLAREGQRAVRQRALSVRVRSVTVDKRL